MRAANSSDHHTAGRREHRIFWSPLSRIVAFLIAVAAAFLLGCFVIAPLINRMQACRQATTAAGTAPETDVASLPPTGTSVKSPPRVKVTITERPAGPPAAAPPAQPPDNAAHPPTSAASTGPPSVSEPVPPPAAEPEANVNPPGLPSLHHVRVGIFADKSRAEALAARLTAAGFSPSIQLVDRSGRTLYSVQTGAFASIDNARTQVEDLRRAGFEATVTTEN